MQRRNYNLLDDSALSEESDIMLNHERATDPHVRAGAMYHITGTN